jgi:hypothetical protein
MQRYTRKPRNRKRKSKAKGKSRKRGGDYPLPSNPIRGGGLDSRYTFSQPLTNAFQSGTYSLSKLWNNFLGHSQGVNPDVLDQPYLKNP